MINRKYNVFILYIYVWIYENRSNFNTTTLTFFQENTQAFSLNQPQAVCLATHSLLTHLACVWLGGFYTRNTSIDLLVEYSIASSVSNPHCK